MKRMRRLAWIASAGLVCAAGGTSACRDGQHPQSKVGEPVTLTAASAPAPFATPPVLPGTLDVAALVKAVKPAVVNVTTLQDVKGPQIALPFDPDDPFGGFFGPFDRREQAPTMKRQGIGSGFIIDAKGYVVTNAHVVEGADSVRVRLSDEREFDATVKGRDPRLDLAVLELRGAKDLPVASLGPSAELQVGEYVVAIGNPFGLGTTVTMGIVSAKSREIGAGPYDDFIQTDASINPGNSGGPLYNLRGQVVGINTAISASGRGIGFAIPSDALKEILPQLLTTGRVARGRLGALIQEVDAPLAKALGLDKPKGALVGELEPGGPAEKAGLRQGDVILSVNGTEITHAHDLPRVVARNAPGAKVKLEVVRDKAPRTFEATLAELKDEPSPDAQGAVPKGPAPELGLELGDAPGGGALVNRVLPGSVADGSLARGDAILEINGAPIARGNDATRHLRAATTTGSPLLFKIRRNGGTRYVAIERR